MANSYFTGVKARRAEMAAHTKEIPKRRRDPFAGGTLRIQVAAHQSQPSVPAKYRATLAACSE